MDTKCVHAGVRPDPTTGSILTPIYQSTTYVQKSVEEYNSLGYCYSRSANPTVSALEEKISVLEGLESNQCACFSTGMAATFATLSAFLSPGDHCIMTQCSYGGTNRCARVHFAKYNIEFDFVDFQDLALVESHVKSNTKMVFSESPTNPVLSLVDVENLSELCKKKKILHVCDATFATPILMQPLKLGVDLVIHSTTKFMDGHNITVGGCVVSKDKELDEQVKLMRNIAGSIMSPQIAFYTLQSLKTLKIRVLKQSETALFLAEELQKHPKIQQVVYPGLAQFPQRQLAKAQHHNDVQGSMLYFQVHGAVPEGKKLMNAISHPWSLCENLGACESIITYPWVFTHGNMLEADRIKAGIFENLIRVSVGLEDPIDLKNSLLKALDTI